MSRQNGGFVGRISVQRDARAVALSAQLGAEAIERRAQQADTQRRAEAAEATARALAARQRAIAARSAQTAQPAAPARETGTQRPRYEQKFTRAAVDRQPDGSKRYRFTI